MSAEVPRVDEQAPELPARQSRALALFGRRALTVIANESLGAYNVLKASDPDGPRPQAGQFAMLAAIERWGAGEDERPYLPRAFSYARWLAGEAHFLLENVGPGTRRLCELCEGETLWALGPLGSGFAVPQSTRHALLVGGGVGIAPLAILSDELRARGVPATVLLGFRDRAHAEGAALVYPYARDSIDEAIREDMLIATDDGSLGQLGFVTDLLDEQLNLHAPSEAQIVQTTVYACGPPPMLEAVRALCEERSVPAQLALEAGMACGFGACYGCVVPKRNGGYLRVCVDGPVLSAAELERIE